MIGQGPKDVSADDPLPADLQAGDTVHRGDIAVVVPDPGQTAAVVADNEDGTVIELVIANDETGRVQLVEAEAPTEPVAVAAFAVPNQCSDGAYHLEGAKWNQQVVWYFDAGTTPSANSVDNVETGIKTAAAAIVNSRNSCGITDQVSATESYAGRTNAKPNLTSSSTAVTCGNTDGKNVVGFGYLPSGTLGITCLWYGADNVTIEADIRLTTRRSWFAEAVPSGCSNRWGIESVATHEFGHAFGLAHVSQTSHPELTMSTQAMPCTNDKLTLGLGDIRGLRALY